MHYGILEKIPRNYILHLHILLIIKNIYITHRCLLSIIKLFFHIILHYYAPNLFY